MRPIKSIVVHCTATHTSATVAAIMRYWREELGWKNPGYHYIIPPDGHTVQLQDERKIANGVRGHNQDSIHVAYIGGLNYDDRSTRQKHVMFHLLRELSAKHPDAEIKGHNDFPGVQKACPQFDVKEWYSMFHLALTT